MINRRHFFALACALGVSLFASGALVGPAHADTAGSVDTKKLMSDEALPDIVMGKQNAPVTIVEYASMTCPHCASFNNTVFPGLKKKYIDTGKVKYILREFPLDPLAAAGFMLARCAPKDHYYDIVNMLYRHQEEWAYTNKPVEALYNMAKQAGFTKQSFQACLTNQKLLDSVNAVKDRAANQFGVNATPTFFINGQEMRGEHSLADFAQTIDPLLQG